MARGQIVIFRRLIKVGNFLAYWRLADLVPVAKESSSSDVGDNRPITFEKIVAGKLSYF